MGEVYLHGLRLFEVVLISKFLSARDKLCTLALLNKAWNKFIFKHYAWYSFPSHVHESSLHLFKQFVS